MTSARPSTVTSALLAALAGASVLGGCGGGTTAGRPPAAPTGFRYTTVTPSSVTLTWNAVSGATGYTLERRGGADAYVQVATPGPAATTYTDTGLSASTSYTYHLSVTTAAGTSPYTADVTATTAAPDPDAPILSGITITNGIAGTPERVTLEGSVTDPNGDLKNVTISWGDGTTTTNSTGLFNPSSDYHEYAVSRSYIVKILANDSVGHESADIQPLDVTRFQTGSQAHFVLNDTDSTARDLSGNKRSGSYTASGCFAPVADRYSVANQAERFNDPALAACTISKSGGMKTAALPLPGDFSVNFWLRPDAARVTRDSWLVGQQGGTFSAYLGRVHGQAGTAGHVSVRLTSPSGGAALTVTDPAAVPGDQWTQYVARLAVTGSGTRTSTLTLYRDGAQVAQATQAGSYALVAGNAAWTVADAQGGAASGAGDAPYSGALDDLRLYDRALAPYEIGALFRLDRYPKP